MYCVKYFVRLRIEEKHYHSLCSVNKAIIYLFYVMMVWWAGYTDAASMDVSSNPCYEPELSVK